MGRTAWEKKIVAQLRLALSSDGRWAVHDGDDDRSVTPSDRATARVVHLLNRAVVGHALACRAAGCGPVDTLLVVRALCRPHILPVLATDRAFVGRALLGRIVTWTIRTLFPENARYTTESAQPRASSSPPGQLILAS